MQDSIIVYHSPLEQQTAEATQLFFNSGDALYFFGGAAIILIAILCYTEWKKDKERQGKTRKNVTTTKHYKEK